MAYYGNEDENNPYSQYSKPTGGGGQGVIGQSASTVGGSGTPPNNNSMAPTSSGSHFVNIQRYLEGQPTYDFQGKADTYANGLISGDQSATDKGIAPLNDWIKGNTPPTHPYGQTDFNSDVAAGGGFNSVDPGRDPGMPGRIRTVGSHFTGDTSGIVPPSYTYTPSTAVTTGVRQLSNPGIGSTPGSPGLMTALATSPSSYTPGMEALDLGIAGASGGLKTSGDATKLQGASSADKSRADAANTNAQSTGQAEKDWVTGAGNWTKNYLNQSGGVPIYGQDRSNLEHLGKILGINIPGAPKAGTAVAPNIPGKYTPPTPHPYVPYDEYWASQGIDPTTGQSTVNTKRANFK